MGTFGSDVKRDFGSARGLNAAVRRPNIGGVSIFDPGNLFAPKKKPPKVAAPPAPVDTTDSMLREISRAETDAELRRSKRQSFTGGSYTPGAGTKTGSL